MFFLSVKLFGPRSIWTFCLGSKLFAKVITIKQMLNDRMCYYTMQYKQSTSHFDFSCITLYLLSHLLHQLCLPWNILFISRDTNVQVPEKKFSPFCPPLNSFFLELSVYSQFICVNTVFIRIYNIYQGTAGLKFSLHFVTETVWDLI